MANPEHVKIVKAGKEAVDKWWKEHPSAPHQYVWREHNSKSVERSFDLREADLCAIHLSDISLRGADLEDANFHCTHFDGTCLEGANLIEANLHHATIKRANFRKTNVTLARFFCATIIHSDFSHALINWTDFTMASLHDVDFSGSKFNASGIDNWFIESITCSHFYNVEITGDCEWKRIPAEGSLAPGEFEDRFKSRPTIEFIFENGMTALAPAVLDSAIGEVNRKEPEAGLRILDITARGGLPRAIIEIADKVSKKDALALIKACFQQKISQLRKEIKGLRQDKDSLLQIASQKMLLPALGSTTSFMSAADLAEQHKVDTEALRKRLDRYRAKHALDTNIYVESQDRGKNKPKYLYNAKTVAPIIEKLKSKQASVKRPSEKK